MAALLPVLLLGSIELGLRLRGYGFSTDFFLQGRRDGIPVATDNALQPVGLSSSASARVGAVLDPGHEG